jgi:glutaredoxin
VTDRVTLLTRADCHLCAAARRDIERICDDLGVSWSELDVDADRELRAEYGDRVPVILVDDREHGYWHVEEDRLRRAITGS